MRAWARDNGYDVADRGRLRPEVLEAYEAAQRKGSAPAKKKAPAAKPAKKAPARKAAAKPAPPAPMPEPQPEPEVAATPEPKPKPVADDRRLVALGEEIAALTERVAQLEKQLSGKSSSGKSTRFRRSK